MEELLGETRFDYSKAKPLERTLHALRELVNSMPRCRVTQEALNLPALTLHHHRKRVALDFAPPERVDLAGSFLLRTCARPVLNVDVVLSMPASCLLRTDHINYHYHDKRALYLGAVARAVMRSASHTWAEAVLFERWLGDPRKPALIIKPGALPPTRCAPSLLRGPLTRTPLPSPCAAKGHGRPFQIRVLVRLRRDVFKLSKLGPDRNNVRRTTESGACTRREQEGRAYRVVMPHTPGPP